MSGLSLSVITPSYNQGQFIERTIQSVLMQKVPGLEYIVVDGASTDNTVEILKKYDSKIKWISEPDKGQTHAINKGFAMTQGDIVGWLNSDDVYYPDSLNTICDFFASHPEVDVVYGEANHIDEQDSIIEKYQTESWNIERLKDVCYICQPAVFLRRSAYEKFGQLNESLQYCMDYEYWLRLATKGANFYYLNQLIAGSRLHSATKTLGSRVKVHKEINDMFKRYFNKVPERWIGNYAHIYVEEQMGIPRTDRRFLMFVSFYLFISSIRWNKKLSFSILKQGARWLRYYRAKSAIKDKG